MSSDNGFSFGRDFLFAKEKSLGSSPTPRTILNTHCNEGILKTLLFLKREGYPESTIETVGRRLRNIAQSCDLFDVDSVKRFIASKKTSDGYKSNLCDAYSHFLRVNGLVWNRPRYKREKKLPRAPTTENVERIISRASWRYACVFSMLRDTGAMPEELHRTKRRDIDLESGVVSLCGCKYHKPRAIKVKPSTLAMLKRYLADGSNEQPFPSSRKTYEAWRRYRNDLAERLGDPQLKAIRLYDLRHYFGTMLYHRTKDILLTKEQMGHSRIETTLIYTKLIRFESEDYMCRVAKSVAEAAALIESGFDFVCEMEDAKLFKKPK
jgi:integrase